MFVAWVVVRSVIFLSVVRSSLPSAPAVKTVEIILSDHVGVAYLRTFRGGVFASEVVGFLASVVHLHDRFGSLGGDDLEVNRLFGVGGVGNSALQRIGGKQVVRSRECFQRCASVGQFGYRLLVGRYLVVEAALEFGALPGKFLRVRREVLQSCSPCSDRREPCHPCRAAQLASAGTCTSYASSLLTSSDLFHLYADAERLGIHLDQLPKIHTSVGDIVEDRFASVSLVLHVTDFHVELHVFGDLACLDHCLVLQRVRFIGSLQVGFCSQTVDTACLEVIDIDTVLAHLRYNELSYQRYLSYVVPGIAFHCHFHTFLERQVVHVAVVAFAGVLELHLHHVRLGYRLRQVGQIIHYR